MTIFYFTASGNSLAVAKRIGGNDAVLVSIPQIIDSSALEYKDNAIGIVFPVYALSCPGMVSRFLSKVRLSADYIFAIGTYGESVGACMRNLVLNAAKRGIVIDYAKGLITVDNYLPGFDVKAQVKSLPKKKTEEKLAQISADIAAQKKLAPRVSLLMRFATASLQRVKGFVIKGTQAQNYIVNGSCIKCGTCARVCPSGNITVADKVTFADKCEGCLGCVHLCPKNALHLKNQRSAERWRHPDVSLAEIIRANDRTR